MLIVLIACIGVDPVCFSWLWSRIIPWFQWPFRLNILIKIESPKGLLKLLWDSKGHPHFLLCQQGPGVLLCGQSLCQAWDGARLLSLLSLEPGAAVGLGSGTALLCSGQSSKAGAASSSPPALLPGQQTSSLPCSAEALPESPIPCEILDYSSLAGEKDGLGFKRLAFTRALVWFVFSL